MKKFIFLTLLTASSCCIANELHNFDAIKAAMTTGKDIHIVIEFSKCAAPNNIPFAITGTFTPRDMLILNNQIITSLMHFTLHNPNYTGKPVYEYVRYAVAEDNNVQITAQTLDAVNYAPLGTARIYNCNIDVGARFYD